MPKSYRELDLRTEAAQLRMLRAQCDLVNWAKAGLRGAKCQGLLCGAQQTVEIRSAAEKSSFIANVNVRVLDEPQLQVYRNDDQGQPSKPSENFANDSLTVNGLRHAATNPCDKKIGWDGREWHKDTQDKQLRLDASLCADIDKGRKEQREEQDCLWVKKLDQHALPNDREERSAFDPMGP